ncbi:hypothetical protein HOLleu_03834 [Holothuria leucospilota]|uniref:CRESS-DNA virus Rep endonuclease domain-containing protein n=1 Tax=Holothuria leucospilota TaxID=206669 RepID=A0A9Q1HKG3_HOLLE|nr:hypothetical protein HOLleu_03834 [Holothuria leucospilota]
MAGNNSLEGHRVRQVYLITYSQADEEKVPSRDDFAQMILAAFISQTTAEPLHWVCSQEAHQDGGTHYHMAIKLNKIYRWRKVRDHLASEQGIQLHFSDIHHDYYSAWQYVTKEDRDAIQSPGHPDLRAGTAPSTSRASERHHEMGDKEGPSGKRRKKARLSSYDVSQIAVSRGIKTRLALLALANQQKAEGKTDLAEFIVNRGKRVAGWEMAEAEEKLKRSKLSRTEIMQQAQCGPCVCNGQWRDCAEEILHKNEIPANVFSKAVLTLLQEGRGKYRNILITGPANCGKTFILNPLNKLYKTFSNPATGSFAWVGAEDAEVLFLNDFRWSAQIIPWHDMLLLLEGQMVHLPAPKTHFTRDIVFDKDTPIFATASHQFVYVRGGEVDSRETEMMTVRWRTTAEPLHWVCSQEAHQDGGTHYHMAIKLNKIYRWRKVRDHLASEQGIQLHFSDIHHDYYSAWQYVTKEDRDAIQSPGHPDLRAGTAPSTSRASERHHEMGDKEGPSGKRRKKARLSSYDVSQIAVSRGIKTRLALLALANQQKAEGKTDLAEFIVNRGKRVAGWEMAEAEEKLKRSKLSRTEIMQQAQCGPCVCNGQWRDCAEEILHKNEIPANVFSKAVLTLLQEGRGKYRNILITGPANCGKTFILNPLNKLYKTFSNPATGSFAWVGAEDAEVLFLNDFRWSAQIIPWHDMLLLLEGQMVHLPAPKTHFTRDIVFDKDTPIFATASHQFVYVRGGEVDSRETEMMTVRWRTTAEPLHWVCSQEAHQDGGTHYHMAIKLNKIYRWRKVRDHLASEQGIQLHFSDIHHDYYSAWQYVTKEDRDAIQSPGHPDLRAGTAPSTSRASERHHEMGDKEGPSGKRRKKARLSSYDVSQIAVSRGIKTRLALLALANQQKAEGKTDLAEFIVNRGKRVAGWEMAEAEEKLKRSKLSRTEIMQQAQCGPCVCNGQWRDCAEEILHKNEIPANVFSKAVLTLLQEGRGKYRNILITGPANCGKTFILNPLNKLYKTFSNPATGSFAWVGAEDAEVLFLNDFRWSAQIIPWHDMLLLLEGQMVHLPAPKTHFTRDIVFDKDTPIFATASHQFVYVRGGEVDSRETEMMTVRWRTTAEPLHWVCSQEAHQDGGTHYHMAIKLNKIYRWRKVRDHLASEQGIQLHFSDIHHDYYSAWQYVTKEDRDAIQSPGHPDLRAGTAPSTSRASERHHEMGDKEGPSGKRRKKARLSSYDVSQIAVSRGIKTRLALLALANQQKAEGKTDLAEFIVNRGKRVAGWEMAEAEEKLKRSKLSRTEIMQQAQCGPCVCNGQWRDCAEEILHKNEIPANVFSKAVLTLLQEGRGKYRNILITGPANCGKTFILNPLNKLYKTFSNPATGSFAWVGAEDAEVLFLNDFRWSAQIIPWHDMLLLLEGQMVHLPAPKTHFTRDIVFDKDTPIFATASHQFVYVRGGEVDSRETEMMTVRWRVFQFFYQIPSQEQKCIPVCPACFSKFIIENAGNNLGTE